MAEIERKNAAIRVKLASVSQDVVPEEDPLDFLEPIKDEFLLSDYVLFHFFDILIIQVANDLW